MKNNNKNNLINKEEEEGAIGIGAMIVFIALILVAAVASAVIIQTGEKLQQNAQSAGEDTSDSMSGKIMIMGGYVDNAGDFAMMVRAAPGSDPIPLANIKTQIQCGTTSDIEDSDANLALEEMDGTGATTINANQGYLLTVPDGGCGVGDVTLFIHVEGGGSTYEILDVSSLDSGTQII